MFHSLKLESQLELLMTLRQPAFVIPTFLFPLMFYIFFGVLFNTGGLGGMMPTYLIVTYGVFGIMSPAMFGFGANIAMEREKGWLAIKQVAPVSPFQLMASKMFIAMVFAAAVVVGLFILGATLGDVVLYRSQWAQLAFVLLLGTIPFCVLGLAVGFWVKGSSAVAILNLIYLPSSFLSGLWIPIQMFPEWLQGVASGLPPYHLAQIGLKIIDMDLGQPLWLHIGSLVAYTIAFSILAALGYKRTLGE